MRSAVGRKRKRHLFIPEAARWLAGPVFPAAVFLSVLFLVADLFADPLWSDMLLSGESGTAAIFFQAGAIIRYAGLCLCSLPAAGFYAEDYGGNAVYMRVQRMGGIRYAVSRILHVFSSAWLCAFLAMFLYLALLVLGFGQFLLEEGDSLGGLIRDEAAGLYLLEQGKVWSAYFVMAAIQGFMAAFYALLALAFSVFVPDRRAVFAVPLLGWFFNQYMLVRMEWLPSWLLPSMVYDNSHILVSVLCVSEWQLFWIVAGYTVAAAILVCILLVFSLKRNGTFGGESE